MDKEMMYEETIESGDHGRFRIDTDRMAEWAIERIKDQRQERDRLIEIAKDKIARLETQIKEIEDKCDSKTGFLEGKLYEYFTSGITTKETKTQKSYKLLSGSLVYKKPKQKIVKADENKLIEALRGTEFVETTEKVKWGDYKKNLEIVDGVVVDTTSGEIVEGCQVEETTPEFSIIVEV